MVNPHSDKKFKTKTTYGPAGMGFAPPTPKPVIDIKQQNEQNESTSNQGITNVLPTSTPQMQTGFGSFFGASSGSTASSPLVQETLKKVFEKAIADRKEQAQEDNQLYTANMQNQAVMDAFENVYPTKYIRDIPVQGPAGMMLPGIKAGDPFKTLSKEEFLDMAGVSGLDENDPLYKDALLDFNIASSFGGNLMDIPEGHRGIEEDFLVQPQFGGGGGRINIGGGGDYGAGIAAGLGRRPKQLGDEEGIPKGLRLLQYMVNLHKNNPYTKMAIRRKNGGIVSLVGG